LLTVLESTTLPAVVPPAPLLVLCLFVFVFVCLCVFRSALAQLAVSRFTSVHQTDRTDHTCTHTRTQSAPIPTPIIFCLLSTITFFFYKYDFTHKSSIFDSHSEFDHASPDPCRSYRVFLCIMNRKRVNTFPTHFAPLHTIIIHHNHHTEHVKHEFASQSQFPHLHPSFPKTAIRLP